MSLEAEKVDVFVGLKVKDAWASNYFKVCLISTAIGSCEGGGEL
jgi:hypothetical protein